MKYIKYSTIKKNDYFIYDEILWLKFNELQAFNPEIGLMSFMPDQTVEVYDKETFVPKKEPFWIKVLIAFPFVMIAAWLVWEFLNN